MTGKLETAFCNQARGCAALGSPFMGQLLGLLADNLTRGTPVMDHILDWDGDVSSSGHSVPLRLAGGLHALVIQGRDATLAAAYPPNTADDATLIAVVLEALQTHADFLLNWLKLPPQTNEVRRSAALIPVGMMLSAEFGLPLTLSELGASAGLNLNFDRFALRLSNQTYGPADPALTLTPDWIGSQLEPRTITVSDRRGVDLNPLTGPQDADRLRAYLWPDQPFRRDLTDAALACGDLPVDKGDAADWLARRLSSPAPNTCHMIYHTVAWQYFPAATQAKCAALITQAGATATQQAPLAWMGMEADDTKEDGARLTLQIWPGHRTIDLGRADFHGRWVRWAPKEH